jgi:hypothetical protein
MQTLKSLSGLNALYVMIDHAKGKAAVVTVWNDAQSAASALSAMAGIRPTRILIGVGLPLAGNTSRTLDCETPCFSPASALFDHGKIEG